MALSKDTPRNWQLGDFQDYPMAAGAVVFEGSALGDNGSGYVRALQAGDPFRGFADDPYDNTTGTNGTIYARARRVGQTELVISGLAITDVDKPVYASDDGTFTLTATGNSYIGRIVRFTTNGNALVEIDPPELGKISTLNDSTGGTASTTLAAIASGTPADLTAQGVINGVIRNAIASLTAQVNAIAQMTK